MQGDSGNCATAFSPACIGDLNAAIGNAVLIQANSNGTDEQVCAGLSASIKIPPSCAAVESVVNQSTSHGMIQNPRQVSIRNRPN
jgi:hypothetical protein